MKHSPAPAMSPDLHHILEESRWLTGLARRLVRDPGMADDLVQETMVAALESKRLPDDAGRRGWLATVMRRKLAGANRSGGRRAARERGVAQPEAVPGPDALIEALEGERLLRDALEELGEPYRRTLLMKYREGLDSKEIARREGCSGGTVRWRCKSGLEQLRIDLERRDHSWARFVMPLASLATPKLGAAAAGGVKWMPAAVALGALLLGALSLKLFGGGADVAPAGQIAAAELRLEQADPGEAGATLALAAQAPAPASPGRLAVEAPVEAEPPTAADFAAVGNHEPGVLRLVVRDERGVPVQGAFARVANPDRSALLGAPSDANGELRLSLEQQWERLEQERVCIAAQGFAARVLSLEFPAEQTHDAGGVVLLPGTAVRGRLIGVDLALPVYLGMIDGPADASFDAVRSRSRHWGDARPQLTGLRFQGVPQRLARGQIEFELTHLEAGRGGQLVAFQAGEPFRFGWSNEIVTGAAQEPIEVELFDGSGGVQTDQVPIHVRLELAAGVDPGRFELRADRPQGGDLQLEPAGLGRFALSARPGESLRLRLNDRLGEYAPIEELTSPIGTGMADRVLRPALAELHGLTVLDPGGEPARSGAVHITAGADLPMEHLAGGASATPGAITTFEDGAVAIQAPANVWRLRIVSDAGWAELGPFEAGVYPGPSTVQLQPAVAATGRVLRGGSPVPGVEISLRPLMKEGRMMRAGGLPTVVAYGAPLQSATTDAAGEFRLDPTAAEGRAVGVELDGVALAVVPLEGARVPDIDLAAVGRVDGVVRGVGGELTGGIVTAWNGLGINRSAIYGVDGSFTFESLPAGRWYFTPTRWLFDAGWVAGREGHDRAGELNFTVNPTPVAWDPGGSSSVDVAAGSMHKVSVDVPVGGIPLELIVRFDGRAPAGSRSMLYPANATEEESLMLLQDLEFDGRGHADVEVARPGEWDLYVEGPGEPRGTILIAKFEVQAMGREGPLEIECATGTVELRGEPLGSIHLTTTATLASGTKITGFTFAEDASGEREIGSVLAGRVELISADWDGWPEPAPVLAEGVLEPGGRLVLELH